MVMLCYVMSATTAAGPARREQTHLQFLGLLAFSSSLLAPLLSTTGSGNSEQCEHEITVRHLVL